MEQKLYLAYLGGKMNGNRIGEDHETVMLVAEDRNKAKKLAKNKWQGEAAAHLDMLVELEVVDGYKINLTKVDQNEVIKTDDNWEELNS